MKKIMVFLTLSMLAVSCGTEEVATRFAPEDNLVTNTALIEKAMRVTQHPTAVDDIVDGCSCFSVKMPYVAYVNDDVVTVNSEADYQQIYDILNESDYDYDFVVLEGNTVTVIYPDYHEETLDTLEFMDAVTACNNAQTELSCVDFVYPVGVNTYNSDNVLAQSFELGSKEALYGFLSTVGNYDAASFTYPISFQQPDETVQPVDSNQGLEEAIDTHADECQTLVIDPSPDALEVITDGTWHISYFYSNTDLTYLYSSYIFTFLEGGDLNVTDGYDTITGLWNYSIYGELMPIDAFSSPELYELQQMWSITNINDTQINLYLAPNGAEPAKYLEFTKN